MIKEKMWRVLHWLTSCNSAVSRVLFNDRAKSTITIKTVTVQLTCKSPWCCLTGGSEAL